MHLSETRTCCSGCAPQQSDAPTKKKINRYSSRIDNSGIRNLTCSNRFDGFEPSCWCLLTSVLPDEGGCCILSPGDDGELIEITVGFTTSSDGIFD